MKSRSYGSLIGIDELVKDAGVEAVEIFEAAANNIIELAVRIDRKTAYTFINEFADGRGAHVDVRLLMPIPHENVSALIIPQSAYRELIDCGRVTCTRFDGGWVEERGVCIKKLLVLDRNFIPGRYEVEKAALQGMKADMTEEWLGEEVISMRSGGGTYCPPIDEERYTELTERFYPSAYDQFRFENNGYNRQSRPFDRFHQRYHYKFGLFERENNEPLISPENGITLPRPKQISLGNVVIESSELKNLYKHIGCENPKISKFLKLKGLLDKQNVGTRAIALRDDPQFKEAEDLAAVWIQDVCLVNSLKCRPAKDLYIVASLAVYVFRAAQNSGKLPGRERVISWLLEFGIPEWSAKAVSPLIRGDRGQLNGKAKKIDIRSSPEPWKRTILQVLFECWRESLTDRKGENITEERVFLPEKTAIEEYLLSRQLKENHLPPSVSMLRASLLSDAKR